MRLVIYHLKDVSYTYEDGNAILNHFNWEIRPKERWALIGPSGCGKTTLLYLLAGLKQPQTGEVLCRGEKAQAPMKGVSFIQQQYGLFRWKTVKQNLALPLLLKKMPRDEIDKRVSKELTRLGLEGMEKRFPKQLSGGQCQRVAIARAIVGNPKLLLADEPTGALDSASGKQVMELFAQLHENGSTIIMITHDQNIADYAESVKFIKDGVLSEGGADNEADNE